MKTRSCVSCQRRIRSDAASDILCSSCIKVFKRCGGRQGLIVVALLIEIAGADAFAGLCRYVTEQRINAKEIRGW